MAAMAWIDRESVMAVDEQAKFGELSQPRNSLRGPLILAKLITDAIEGKRKGDSSDYHAITEQLSAKEMRAVVMGRWLQALSLCVSQLSKEFDILVGVTLRFRWYDKGAEVAELYIDYLTHLLSAQTYYLQSSLQSLVSVLFSRYPLPPAPAPPSEGGRGLGEAVGETKVYLNVHDALLAVLHIVPTAPSVLMPLLNKRFPFKGKSAELQELAVRNVLHVISYCPSLRNDILHLVMHQMISIDVEIPRLEVEEEEEEAELGGGDREGGTQFHVEMESPAESKVTTNGHCHSNEAPPISLVPVYSCQHVMTNDMAEKLDVLMTILFQYCHSVCRQNNKVCTDSAVGLFQSLLKIFEQIVLPTHACSHVQFIVFKLTSYHEAFPDHFMDFLWEKFQDFNTPAVIRQTTAAYMASYIARAKFVPLRLAKLCLTIMTQWIHQYIDNCVLDHLKPDARQHGPFYSLCQAVFYIFVFKHRPLLEMEGGVGFLRQLHLDRVVTSRLNPLKVCLPTVVELFASLTSRHEIVFCYTILEENKRRVLSAVPGQLVAGQTATPTNYLDSFFPFDPYGLKRSSPSIEPLYQEWEGPAEEEGGAPDVMEDELGSLPSSYQGSSYGDPLQVPSSVDSLCEHFSPAF